MPFVVLSNDTISINHYSKNITDCNTSTIHCWPFLWLLYVLAGKPKPTGLPKDEDKSEGT